MRAHSRLCNLEPVFFIFLKNIMLFLSHLNKVRFTGAPYLDANNFDDCQLLQRTPLYLNGELLNNLENHLLWDLEYKADSTQVVSFVQLKSVIDSWFDKE